MPTVHLVRHGEVANPNHVVYADLEGFNLSATGVLQAHHAARHLESFPVDIVLTSPLARAVQTAAAIGSHHDLKPTVRMGLTETRQYPGWTGERWEDIAGLFPGQLERYLADASSLDDVVETIHHVASRVITEIERVIDHGAQHIVVVGHQDPTQAARLSLIGRQLSELLMDPPSHASVVTLERPDDGGWREMAVWEPFIDQAVTRQRVDRPAVVDRGGISPGSPTGGASGSSSV